MWLKNPEERKERLLKKTKDIFFKIEKDMDDKTYSQIKSTLWNEKPKSYIWMFVCRAIYQAPDYFWTRPSSITGKYHPADEFCAGGLVLHTYKALLLAEEMLRGIDDWDMLSNETVKENKEIFIAAIVLHDLYASGKPEQLYYKDEQLGTDPLHMLYVRPMLQDILLSDNYSQDCLAKNYVWFDVIMRLIEGHYGPWSPLPQVKPDNKFADLVYYIDYIISRNFVNINID